MGFPALCPGVPETKKKKKKKKKKKISLTVSEHKCNLS